MFLLAYWLGAGVASVDVLAPLDLELVVVNPTFGLANTLPES